MTKEKEDLNSTIKDIVEWLIEHKEGIVYHGIGGSEFTISNIDTSTIECEARRVKFGSANGPEFITVYEFLQGQWTPSSYCLFLKGLEEL